MQHKGKGQFVQRVCGVGMFLAIHIREYCRSIAKETAALSSWPLPQAPLLKAYGSRFVASMGLSSTGDLRYPKHPHGIIPAAESGRSA